MSGARQLLYSRHTRAREQRQTTHRSPALWRRSRPAANRYSQLFSRIGVYHGEAMSTTLRAWAVSLASAAGAVVVPADAARLSPSRQAPTTQTPPRGAGLVI